jgi:hypothetical protein
LPVERESAPSCASINAALHDATIAPDRNTQKLLCSCIDSAAETGVAPVVVVESTLPIATVLCVCMAWHDGSGMQADATCPVTRLGHRSICVSNCVVLQVHAPAEVALSPQSEQHRRLCDDSRSIL